MPPQKFTASDLVPGRTYRVKAAFQDYDRQTHAAGECWRFLEKSFAPYDDGLSLFVDKEGSRTQIRLQWRHDAQAAIIDRFSDFVEEI